MEKDNVKTRYDKELKILENRPENYFRKDYPVYFAREIFEKEILNQMNEEDRKAYGEGAGGELNDGNEPAKMSSVASSSRFCYLSLKDTDFSVFGINEDSFHRRFEEKLNVVPGTPPHMDCYYENGDELVFFECKCHEQFDYHDIKLSTSYFKKDRLVCKIDDVFYDKKNEPEIKIIDGVKKTYYYNYINPKVVGLSDNPRFDVKQFFTHIMGIEARLAKLRKPKGRLIYYYFIPDNALKDKEIEEVIKSLYKEIETVFKSPFVTNNIKNIKFELFVQFSDKVSSASIENTRKIVFNR